MSHEELRYDRLVEAALRGVVRQALQAAAPDATPGDHHFYLTFRTRAPGVNIPEFLLAQYPEEMTIVLQHQFWNLKATDEYFEVTLSFSNRPADLHVPFAALTAFIDPSVKFGLQFNAEIARGDDAATADIRPANSGDAPKLPAVPARPGVPATTPAKPPITAPSDEAEARDAAKAREAAKRESESADVVSLDSFRKK
jgi:hypothetical protein